jgi:hypothetical protein
MPVPITGPAQGTVLDTAAVDWLIIVARQNPSPGATVIHTSE